MPPLVLAIESNLADLQDSRVQIRRRQGGESAKRGRGGVALSWSSRVRCLSEVGCQPYGTELPSLPAYDTVKI